MNIMITGGAGFIGSNIADALIAKGHRVIVVDNLITGKKENIPPKAVFYETDIRDLSMDNIFFKEKIDVVCHHAAQMDVRKSVTDPVFDAQVNVIGMLNLLQTCVRHRVKKFIFASTGGAIYGEQDYFPADEEHPMRPCSPYGITKLTGEKYLYFYRQTYGLSYVILRYANVYGPRQNPHGEAGVVAIFCNKMLSGEQPVINGDGKQTRDYVYVDDVVTANLSALDYKESDYFNIGTGVETDVNTLFRTLREELRSDAKEVHGEAKPGEQQRSVLSYDKAARLLNWKPETDIISGLKKTAVYFRNQHT